MKIRNILFVCYANTCRSPAAEYLARYYANKYNLEGVSFSSAGWHDAFENAQPETINYVESKGIKMSDFQPKVLTKEILEKQDLIIGMENYHLLKIKKKFKEINLKDKMFTLKQFNGADKNNYNIPDPYKTGIDNYNRILKIVEENIEKLVKKICNLNSNKRIGSLS
ncbi:MAG TPA: hypothetical protein VGB37_08770 [Candidatus Lokiarchaeia archaeon]